MKLLLYLTLFISIFTTHLVTAKTKKNCEGLKASFKSYPKAYLAIKATQFAIHRKRKIEASTYLHKLEFYSCDKERGYLIIEYKNNLAFVHQNVSFSIWQDLEFQPDPLSYYLLNIKNNYKYELSIDKTKDK